MSAVEVTGKTLAEAKQLAAEKLGVEIDSLSVTVLEEVKGRGLFGAGKVRLRAEATSASATSAVVETAAESAVAVSEPAEEQPASKAQSKPKAEKKPSARGKAQKAEPAEGAAAEASEQGEEAAQGGAKPEVIATQADGEAMLGILQGLLEAGELEVTAATTQLSGRYVTIEIDGKDVAFLVGKHGEVLNALQYLMNIIAGRKLSNGVRATLDGNQYRHRREEALTKLATNIANEVKARGEEAVLDALPAFERRIVHKALSEYAGVTTYSEGEEPNRRVVIAPAD